MTHLSTEEQDFIQAHLQDDPATLLLRAGLPATIRPRLVAAQLTARQKARTKLPAWYANPAIIFPATLSVEQASSERTAAYKASLLTPSAGETDSLLIDLTGGMGVDALAFAQRVGQVIYVEQQPELAELAAYNLPLLGGTNLVFHRQNSIEFIRSFSGHADWIYLDPARRDQKGGKVVRLEDCEPGLDAYQSALEHADRLLLKTSPLIDIEAALRQLPQTSAVHVVAVDNECKEVLFVLSQTGNPTVPITAVNLRTHGPDETFTFRRADEGQSVIEFSEPLRYLYEPNASILKAGAFRSIAQQFGLRKLAPNSHLYTSDAIVQDFPGRSFAVETVCKPDRKEVARVLPEPKANLTVRNFPEPADVLRKKLGLADGGTAYLFATTFLDKKKRIVITRKLAEPSLNS